MLVHFIGGPAHGHSEAIQNPHDVLRVPEMPKTAEFVSDAVLPPLEVQYIEHQYKVTRRTKRYVIAEWQPESVIATVTVEISLPYYDHEAYDAISRWLWERHDYPQRGDAKLVAVSKYCAENWSLDFAVKVDGPPDAVAVAEAGEKVQHYLDSQIPRTARDKVLIKRAGISVS